MSTNVTCFECGQADLEMKIMPFVGARYGEEFTVEVPGMFCPSCGFQTLDSDQGEALTLAVSVAYRRRHGLLTETEIKARRQQAAMSQQQFADYLGVGVATVKRWEAGQIQDKAMDELLRLKTDLAFARVNVNTVADLFHAPPVVI